MRFAKEHRDIILSSYRSGMSAAQIAKKLGTYSNKILRALKYLKEPRRSYSEAQSLAIENGVAEHPTKGKKVSDKTKAKLSKKISQVWEKMSDEEKERRSQISKEQWAAMSEAEKQQLRDMATEAIREASVNGSKTEKFIQEKLTEDGWNINFHAKDFLPSHSNLEVDMVVTDLKTAIEIDGPSHFQPIWGEERLAKRQVEDAKKEGILLSYGYVLIRVKQLCKTMSLHKQEKTLKMIREELKKINEEFPPKGQRLIEIEVS